jgi:hypothetical protein
VIGLTGNQLRALREAIDAGTEGAYIGISSSIGREAGALVDAGLATIREEPQSGGTRGPWDPRPCEWTDRFLVPTDAGRRASEVYAEKAAEDNVRAAGRLRKVGWT